MGNSTEEETQAKTERSSPKSDPDVSSYQVYPDWAAVQAFYGPRVALMPYLNSTVASSAPTSPYMWPPPPHSMIPHAAFYALYPHPGVSVVGSAPTMESPAKSSVASVGGFMKKDKESNELAISIANANGDNNDGNEHQLSDSEATNGSSGGSIGMFPSAAKSARKRILQETANEDVKGEKDCPIPAAEFGKANENSADTISPGDAPPTKSEDTGIDLDLKNVKPTTIQQFPSEVWPQNERELKRERRKQSNRESARRSRIRKQAETEELANRVQALTSENMNLKSEITRLLESSAKLKFQNAALMEKLKRARLGETRDDQKLTVNLLERVNNAGVVDNEKDDDGEVYESRSPPVTLHQLLDDSPRTDAVAAS